MARREGGGAFVGVAHPPTLKITSELRKRCGAKGIRTPDLLDANESTWAFGLADSVGGVENALVKALKRLAGKGGR
jgi:hypothetical protein